jgi:hypothetical protein
MTAAVPVWKTSVWIVPTRWRRCWRRTPSSSLPAVPIAALACPTASIRRFRPLSACWRRYRTLSAGRRTTGQIAPKPHAGGQKPRLDAVAQTIVRRLVDEPPDPTLEHRCARLAKEAGIRVSVPTMCRVQRLTLRPVT